MPAKRVTQLTPIHWVLVLDNSGSMQNAAATVNAAIDQFVDVTRRMSNGGGKHYARFSVVRFGSKAELLISHQTERDIYRSNLKVIDAQSGGTNAAIALGKAIEVLQKFPGRETDHAPCVILLTDGVFDDAVQAVAKAHELQALDLASGKPKLIALGFGEANLDNLQMIATKTGPARIPMAKLCATPSDLMELLPMLGTIGFDMPVHANSDGIESAWLSSLNLNDDYVASLRL